MPGSEPVVIRSYQRIFRPERRLYQIDGRRLPVPGGVPLRWLGWASGALLAVLALSAGSPLVAVAAGVAGGLAGLVAGGRRPALVCGAVALVAVPATAVVLGVFDWPLRLVVLPALVATLATQATPDGRRADRFAWSWLGARLAPRRSSLGRPIPASRGAAACGGELWVAAGDGPGLRRGRIRGPAVVSFGIPVSVDRGSLCGRRLVARAQVQSDGAGARPVSVMLEGGERLEVRP